MGVAMHAVEGYERGAKAKSRGWARGGRSKQGGHIE